MARGAVSELWQRDAMLKQMLNRIARFEAATNEHFASGDCPVAVYRLLRVERDRFEPRTPLQLR